MRFRFCINNFVHCRQEIIIDLLLEEVHPTLRVEMVEGAETTGWVSAMRGESERVDWDWDELAELSIFIEFFQPD